MHIVTGLRLREPNIDMATVYDVGLASADDPTILSWAAQNDRIVVTHDVRTMVEFAYDRVRSGQPMSGLYHIPARIPVAEAVEDLLYVATCTFPSDWENLVRHFPLS